jgi:AraC family transcriptional regulator
MTELAASFQKAGSRPPADTLDSPLLYLSSRQAGWEGLVADAFYEPTQLQGWMPKAIPDITLILFAGGPMRIHAHFENGPWTTLVMHEGEFVLRPSMVAPYEISWKSLTSIPTRTLHIHLSQRLLRRTAEELAGYDPARLYLTEELASYDPAQLALSRRSGFQDALLRQIGLALWRELEQSAPGGKLYAQTAAQMLAVHLLRYYTSAQIQIKEVSQFLTQRQVKRVTDFVIADLRQDLSLETLAEQVGYSPYHFARLFRQTVGESPHQFVLRQRIEKAKDLLKATNAPLANVALESGFANQSHLTRIFERHLGLTPKAYRERC